MIRALMWKEYREHRAIWLTLAVVGGAGLFGLQQLMTPDGFLSHSAARESLQSVAVLFAWTYGLVCGAMLLANECESGTMTFLDTLPAWRLQLWLGKCLIGVLLLVTQVAVLGVVVVALGITETTAQLSLTVAGMLILGLIALSWSLLFSAWGENVLNVIGLSFVGQIAGTLLVLLLLSPVTLVLMMIQSRRPSDGEAFRLVLICLGLVGLTGGPILGSARLFTRLDRQRGHAGRWNSRPPADLSAWASWGRLLWLSFRQMRRLLIGLVLFSLAMGLLLLLLGPAAWPMLTLLIGILCGVTVWGDEQISAAFRFLGDQRVPLGRVWIVKVGMRFALAVFAAFLLLLPSLIASVIHQVEAHSQLEQVPFAAPRHFPFFADLFRSNLVGPIVPVWTHLSMWLLYGFTAGQLCGLLFRKSLVAAVVALGSSGMLLCLWAPSLLGIGLHFWQAAGVPLVLLLAGRWLMAAWTADRLLARGTFVRLGVVLSAGAVWTIGGLWYRVAEVPDVEDAFDMPAFTASIPSMDPAKNPAGVAMHAAWHEVESMIQDMFSNRVRVGKPLFPPEGIENGGNWFSSELRAVLSRGWPNPPPDSHLGDKLDFWFEREWYSHLSEVPRSPLGVVEDAKLMQLNDQRGRGRWELLARLNEVLMVRGLQLQARGNHDAFVEDLRIGLALSRNMQNRAPPLLILFGRQGELPCVRAIDRWLEKLPGRPDLLQRARDVLVEHQSQLPVELDVVRTEYLIAQNTLESGPWVLVEGEINAKGEPTSTRPEQQRAEMELVSPLWRYISWEHERHQRILRVVFEGSDGQRRLVEKWGGSYISKLNQEAERIKQRDRQDAASLSAALLKVGLRLYQAKNGKFPHRLAELVQHMDPKLRHLNYLPVNPADPFSNRSFRYRLEEGKDGRPAQPRLWSVGRDGHDEGGQIDDLTFPVPLPPR